MNKKKITAIVAAIVVILVIIIILLCCLMNKKYTVKFDSKGGTEITSQVVKKGQKVLKPEEPKKEGYEFLGWYISEDSTTKFNFNNTIKEDITLVAKWKEIEEKDIKEIKIEAGKNVIEVNEELTLMVKTTDGESTEGLETTWKSSDESVATIDENGKVKALKVGVTTITVKVGDKTASFIITVKEPEVVQEPMNTNTNTNISKKPTNTNRKPTTTKPTPTPAPTPDTKPEPTPTPEVKPEEPKEDIYKVSVTTTNSDPDGITPQRRVIITKNGTSTSATAVCDANKKVITDASSNWKIDKSEASAITYVLINGKYHKISK